MNLILVSGVMRSGSTWAFNVCRSLGYAAAQATNQDLASDYLEGEALDELLLAQSARSVVVVKTHNTHYAMRSMIESGIVRNVCTVRDPRDCVASRILFKSETLDEAIAKVKGSFADATRYGRGTLRVLYPDIINEPVRTIREIGAYLLLDVPENHARELAGELSMENMRQHADELTAEAGAVEAHGGLVDPVTNLHKNHIHGGTVGRYKEELTAKQVRRTEKALRDEIAWYRELAAQRGH